MISLGRLRQHQHRGSLSCRKSRAAISGIARFPANAPERQPSAELACVWKFRASAAISGILSQQTTYSASLPDSSPTNDNANLRHLPETISIRSNSSKRLPRSSAGHKASLGQQTKSPTRRIICPVKKLSLPRQIFCTLCQPSPAPNSLASGSIVCNFGNQLRQAKHRANPEDLHPVEKALAAISCIARVPSNNTKRQPIVQFACVCEFRAPAAVSTIPSVQTICSAKLAIFSASLRDPWPADDSANFQHVPASDCDPLKFQHSQRNFQDPRPAKRPSLAWPAIALQRQPRVLQKKP